MRATMGIVASGQIEPVASFAYDASSNATARSGLVGLTDPLTWTHTPVGIPKGVLVMCGTEASAGNVVSGVTYGGVTMTQVALSPLSPTINTETCWAHGYFLGSSIPTGAQTVSVDLTAITGYGSFNAAAWTVVGPNDSAIEDTSTATVLDASPSANPTVGLTIANQSFCAGLLISGQVTAAAVTVGAALTETLEIDVGSQVQSYARKTALASTDTTLDWTAASESYGILAVAIKST